jgi:hypothetical protein
MTVIDFATARLAREVARRKPVGRLAVEWVFDDDGEPIVHLSFDYNEGEVGNAHAFLARYLPSLATHLYSLASSSEEDEASVPAGSGTNL